MAFKIFPKSPKVGSPKLELAPIDAAGKPGKDGRNLADPATTISRHHGDTELGGWAPQAARIEVEEEGALGPSLENAALMFAHGNATAATAALVHALDTAERSLPMVWMCLFDLYARADDRASFEELALRFVVQFERSAPAWDEMAVGSNAASKPTATAAVRAKPKSLLRGDLTDPHAPVIVALSEAAKRKETSPAPQRFDLDIAELNGVNDVCGTLLAGALAALRRKGAVISFRALDATIRRLSAPLKAGERTRKGQWYLVLELLQWSAQTATFDDRAVDFAVTFEISPPSLEALTPLQRSVLTTQSAEADEPDEALVDDRVIWVGELKGAADPSLKTVAVDKVTTNPVVVDMRQVLRVDFVCGGAIANAFTRLMAQAIDVRVLGATPIIQVLLQLTGAPTSLFVKTA